MNGETLVSTTTTAGWQHGLARAMPIVFGYVPIGFAYGVLAQGAGLSVRHTLLMSLIVYAGASQFIAAGLLAGGAPALSIIATTFLVNLRHMLMSASMVPVLRGWRRLPLAAFACQLTDETFAVHVADPTAGPSERFVINIAAQAAWVSGSWLGAVGAGLIPDIRPWGIDYALPAMFCALLAMQIRSRTEAGVALLSGLGAVGLVLLGFDRWAVILATLAGATAGLLGERWTNARSR